MQTGNILQIPFRRTQPLQLSTAIRQYISTKYDQHPDTFTRDLEVLDQLRKDAVLTTSAEPHSSGVHKLQEYAAQLVWMGGKFPVDIGADFTWYPAIGYYTHRAQTENNIRFELANVLFNLGALYSQLGVACNRGSVDGLKAAANNFCLAAGVFDDLHRRVLPEMRGSRAPEEMDGPTLEALRALMLAQAQECFWSKAIKDSLRDGTVAKLAVTTSDYYAEAGEWAVKSESVRSEWIHHVNAKHYHFAGAAQYRAALESLEKQKYGEEVARLRDAVNCANQGLRIKPLSNQVIIELTGLRDRAAGYLKTAENDNDKIYLQIEPAKSELPAIGRASMVSVKVPREVSHSQELLGDQGELGRPLFTKLVPYSVHVAATIYADRRDTLVNKTIIVEYDALTEKIHELLSSLHLPGSLQALEKPLGLPPGLASHADEVRQAHGVQALHATIADTDKIKMSNRVAYQEAVELLQTEASEDDAARRRFGTSQWSRPPGHEVVPKLYAQIKDIEGYLQQADELDSRVQAKLRENESLIRLLSGSDRDLEDFVPSSRRATMTAKVEREANALRAVLNDLARFETRRRKKVEALRTKAAEDNVHPDLRLETARLEREHPMQPVQAAQFEPLFDARLEKYAPDRRELASEAREQATLLQRVQDANAAFAAARRSDTSTATAAREQALQQLENAYMTWKGLLRDLDQGRKFYNDLAAITQRFRDEARHFTYSRREEGAAAAQELETAMASLQLRETTERDLRRAREEQGQLQQQMAAPVANMAQEKGTGGSSGAPAAAHAAAQKKENANPLPAPTPQRPAQQPPVVGKVQSPEPAGAAAAAAAQQPVRTTWQEGMPIVFDSAGGAGAGAAATGADSAGGAGGKPGGPVDGRWDPSKGLQFGRK